MQRLPKFTVTQAASINLATPNDDGATHRIAPQAPQLLDAQQVHAVGDGAPHAGERLVVAEAAHLNGEDTHDQGSEERPPYV